MNGQVDLIALARAEREVAEGLVALANLSSARDEFFWKTVTIFSGRLFCLGGVDEGVAVLSMVPPEYFRGPAIGQMEQDPLFADLAKRIADCLIDAGKVTPPSVAYDRRKVNIASEFGRA